MSVVEDTTIYLRVTSRCNAACAFCYRDSPGHPGPSLAQVKAVVDKVKALGFRRLGLLGGEGFLRKDLADILAYGHRRGLELIVPSNGSLVGDKEIALLNKYVRWFGLPLDGSSKEKSHKMRASFDQFFVTTGLLRQFQTHKPRFKVRISTLVTKINEEDLIDIGKVLFDSKDLHAPDGWRLLKFLELERGAKSSDRFRLTEREFRSAAGKAIRLFGSEHNVSCTNSNYLIISPDARLLVSKGNQYLDRGDLLAMDRRRLEVVVGRDILRKTSENSSWRR
jgi:MoaA/NifB/PqqE/SkfB family radical SAM enzyme